MATKADVEAKLSSNLRWIVGSVFTAAAAIIFSIVRIMG